MTAIFRDCESESVAVRIVRTITRATRRFIPFKINPDLYTSWQMATESGAEITQSTASGRLRVVYVVKESGEISLGIKKTPRVLSPEWRKPGVV